MKIKKSELLALIKEEIMAEAEMFQMSETLGDDSVMRVAEKMGVPVDELQAILSAEGLSIVSDAAAPMSDDERDDYLSGHGAHKSRRTSTEPVFDGSGRTPLGSLAQGELREGMDAESMQIVADAVQKMAPLLGAMSLPVLIGLIYEKLKEMGAK